MGNQNKKVRCAYCRTLIDINKAVAVPQGQRAYYYCQSHTGPTNFRDAFYDKFLQIQSLTTSTYMFKSEFDTLGKVYGWQKMNYYLETNLSRFSSLIEKKQFTSISGLCRYFGAIFRSELPNFRYDGPEVHVHKKQEEIPSNQNYKSSKKRIDFTELLG